MNNLSANTYRENRARFSKDELSKFEGQWVAFSQDGRRIVAGAASIAELSKVLDEAEEDLRHVVLEHIDREEKEINLGGVEFS